MKNSILSLVCFLLPIAAFSQAGTLDQTWGNNGSAILSVGSSSSWANNVFVLDNGGVIAVGLATTMTSQGNGTPFASRFNTDGSLNLTFGNNGSVVESNVLADVTKGWEVAAVYSDSSFAVSHAQDSVDFFVQRYLPSGQVDSSFAQFGRLYTRADAMTVQPDQKLLTIQTQQPILRRFNLDGSVDSTFANNGEIVLPFPSLFPRPAGIHVLLNGDILVGAHVPVFPGGWTFSVARLTANGQMDMNYGNGGIANPPSEIGFNYVNGIDMAVDPSGNVYLTGERAGGLQAIKFLLTGNMDVSYGSGGVAEVDPGFPALSTEVALQSDGKLIIAGRDSTNSQNFILCRLLPSGALDASFGTGGIVVNDLGNSMLKRIESITLQNDGKILAAGALGQDIIVARFLGDGISTGIEETLGHHGQLVISPNPTRGLVNVSGAHENSELRVFKSDGRLVLVNEAGQTGLDLANLSKGVYIIKDDQGRQSRVIVH